MDKNKGRYIEILREAVAIKSVSGEPELRGECDRMVEWTKAKLEAVGVTCELKDVGNEILPDGGEIPLTKVLLGQLGNVSRREYREY